MSKTKSAIEELRTKLFDRQKQEAVEEVQQQVESKLDSVIYDVIQDPTKTNREFLILKLKYNLDTKEAAIVDVQKFQDKTAGLSIQLAKENLKYLFEKNKNRGDNENK